MATALRPAGEDVAEVEVRWEDQQKINKFGALTNTKDELKDLVAMAEVRRCGSQLALAPCTPAPPLCHHSASWRRSRTPWMPLRRGR